MLFSRKINLLALSCAIALTSTTASAIVVTTEQDALTLTNALIIPGSGINVTSSSLSGGIFGGGENGGGECDGEVCNSELIPQSFASLTTGSFTSQQAGTYTNASGVYGLPSQGGIVLSSGFVEDYQDGPNTSDSKTGGGGTFASEEQNALLSTLSGKSNHRDPIELGITFDVADNVNTISFIAAFGSEEYPEFVNSNFNDAFGMFLNGQLVSGVLPTGGVPGDALLPVNIDHPDFAPIEGTELNGMLAPNDIPLLRFDIPVEPGSTGNSFSIIIADAGDAGYDSTVFLSSFGNFDSESGNSEFTPILPDPSNPTNDEGAFVFDLPELEEGQTIWIDPDVATGYVYTTDGEFGSVTAPTLLTVFDLDGFIIHYTDQFGDHSEILLAGQTLNFGDGVSTFRLDGINPDLALDPTNVTAFTLGIAFNSNIGNFVTQNPITTFVPDGTSVPEPSSIILFGLALFGLSSVARKKRS